MLREIIYNCPFAKIFIKYDNHALHYVGFTQNNELVALHITEPDNTLIKHTFTQFNEYFAGKRKTFDLPYMLDGTEFQQSVWKALCSIPYGETRSYKDMAIAVGNPRGCRAVGLANNKNPISIIVPCHRVIASSGHLSGYGGGIKMKQALLDLEDKK